MRQLYLAMRSTILFTVALCIAASSAQDLGPTTAHSTSSAPSSLTYGGSFASAPSTYPGGSFSSAPPTYPGDSFSYAPTTYPGGSFSSEVSGTHSGHSKKSSHSKATMNTTSASATYYTNTSITPTLTFPSNTVPTSIIVATGTPTIPTEQPSTATSFTFVPPPTTSVPPTTQNGASMDGKVVGLPGLALVLLIVSALVIV